MSAPPKPWESGNMNNRAGNSTLPPCCRPNPSSVASSPSLRGNLQSAASRPTLAPPPVPTRPQAQRRYGTPGYGSYGGYGGGMSSYGGMYGGYGNYSMGVYGMGGGYGGYGMNRFGTNNPAGTSTFVRRAEESSQAAFQSIESLVQAFSSISMMLESTYFAVTNSFHAVLGVADHFSQLRTHLISIFGLRAIYRTVKYIVRKIMELLRLRESGGIEEEIWQDSGVAVVSSGSPKKSSKSWPIIMFFAVVLGTPWLIWKFLQSIAGDIEESDRNWMTGTGDHLIARAEYDFQGEGEDELSFRTGQILKLAPKEKQPRIKGWLLGTVDGQNKGIIPANYIKILGIKRRKSPSDTGMVPKRNENCDQQSVSPNTTDEQNLNEVFSETSQNGTSETDDVAFQLGEDLQEISEPSE